MVNAISFIYLIPNFSYSFKKNRKTNQMRYKSFLLLICISALQISILMQSEFSLEIFSKTQNELTLQSSENDSWIKFWGGSDIEHTYALAIDSSGNIYIAGETLSFYTGDYSIFLLKYSDSGEKLWHRVWGGNRKCYFHALSIDSSDNIYIAGSTNFGWPTSTDMLLLKFSSSGDLEWDIIWGEGGWGRGYAVVSDSSDNVYVSGYKYSNVMDIYLMKLNSSGNLLWEKNWGGNKADQARVMEIDKSENIYVLGETKSYGSGSTDVCLLKYNKQGVLQWNQTWGGRGTEIINSLKLDSSNNIYVLGEVRGLEDVDIFLLKYDHSGNFQWNMMWGGNRTDYPRALNVDSSDNVYVAGDMYNYYTRYHDIALLKINCSGEKLWDYCWKKGGSSTGSAITFDIYDNIYVVGEFFSNDFPSLDLSVLRFSSTGILTGYYVWGGEDREYGSEIAIDAYGNLYIAGETYSYGSGRSDVFLLKNPSIIQVYPSLIKSTLVIWANLIGIISGILFWFILNFHKNRRKIELK